MNMPTDPLFWEIVGALVGLCIYMCAEITAVGCMFKDEARPWVIASWVGAGLFFYSVIHLVWRVFL